MDKQVRYIHIPFEINLHRRMREQAIREDKNLREFLEQCVRYYLNALDTVLPKENSEHQD